MTKLLNISWIDTHSNVPMAGFSIIFTGTSSLNKYGSVFSCFDLIYCAYRHFKQYFLL